MDFKFNTKEAAQTFIDKVNKGEGIPKPNGATLTYTEPYFKDGFWWVINDEVTEQYIGF